ncbi:MAG: polysaccharide biosynthesis/export family protein [Elainellaceae cyanobacterium]
MVEQGSSNKKQIVLHEIVSLLILVVGITINSASASAQPSPLNQPSSLPADNTFAQPEEGEEIPESYRLGVGDRIAISVFGASEYSGEALVLSDGFLNLPTAGSVYVEGLTLQETAAAITAQYSRFIRRPYVTVTLAALRPVRVAIAGEVNRPGSYNLSAEGQTEFPTLTDAIEFAGGITSNADLRQIQVRRQQAGTERVITVNLWDMLYTGDLSRDIVIHGGDSILISEAEALDPADALQLGTASFAPDTVTIYVVGEVESPGAISLPQNTPLNQALLAAGGFNPRRAETDSVRLLRLNDNGTASQQIIPVDFDQGINPESNPTLQNNDVIVVGRSGLAAFSDTSEQILGPFGRIFSTFLGIFNVFD